ncbi:MAG: transcriptional regulator, partial [Flavobacteriales bacterium]|nr:transcriptional regulator [Flavobacteriales bacterium]
ATPSLFDKEEQEVSNTSHKEMVNLNLQNSSDGSLIDKIVIFYRNGTFKIYEN